MRAYMQSWTDGMRHSLYRLSVLGLSLGLSLSGAGAERSPHKVDGAMVAAVGTPSAGFPANGWTEAERLGDDFSRRDASDGSTGADGETRAGRTSFAHPNRWGSTVRALPLRPAAVRRGFGARLLGLHTSPANAPPQS